MLFLSQDGYCYHLLLLSNSEAPVPNLAIVIAEWTKNDFRFNNYKELDIVVSQKWVRQEVKVR